MAKKNKKDKGVWIALDADPLVFDATGDDSRLKRTFSVRDQGNVKSKGYKEPLKPYKKKFKLLVQDIVDEASVALLGKVKIRGIKIIFSDPNTNFRYDLYPEYKAGRAERTKTFYRLRKWCHKKYGYVENVEADDVVSHYVREKGYIGATIDKDMLNGVPGIWFDTYYTRRHIKETSPVEARNFNLIQTLTGDPTDNIKALPKTKGDPMVDGVPAPGKRKPFKVTEKQAIELLDEFGWDWNGVVKAYESKGFTEKEAILTRRLICMAQWHPKKGVKLWEPKKTN